MSTSEQATKLLKEIEELQETGYEYSHRLHDFAYFESQYPEAAKIMKKQTEILKLLLSNVSIAIVIHES